MYANSLFVRKFSIFYLWHFSNYLVFPFAVDWVDPIDPERIGCYWDVSPGFFNPGIHPPDPIPSPVCEKLC